jgi:hypothetical protein
MSYSCQRGRFGFWNLRSPVGLADFALKQPSASIASMIPVGLMEVGAELRRPVDILPEIDIPVDF